MVADIDLWYSFVIPPRAHTHPFNPLPDRVSDFIVDGSDTNATGFANNVLGLAGVSTQTEPPSDDMSCLAVVCLRSEAEPDDDDDDDDDNDDGNNNNNNINNNNGGDGGNNDGGNHGGDADKALPPN